MDRERMIESVREGLYAAERFAVDAHKNNLDVDQIDRLSREKLDEILERDGYSFEQVYEFLRSEFIDYDDGDHVDEEPYELLTFMQSLE